MSSVPPPSSSSRPQVVIVGGGFGGLEAARTLARAPVRVTLLDRQNHHVFQPLLYQVATAALSPADIASPIRWILRKEKAVSVLLAEVTAVDPARRSVRLHGTELGYDFLVLAAGAAHAYFGHDEWQASAPGLKTLDDALEIRRRVLLAFERAELATEPAERNRLLRFAIVGGGPTGVELAGALAEIARHTLAHDFRRIEPGEAEILLVEAGPTILPSFPDALQERAQADLSRLGVTVRLGTLVTGVSEKQLEVRPTAGGPVELVEVATTIWAAGVAASPLARSLGVPLDRAGRVRVEPDLTVPGHPEIFVIGDMAAFEQDGALLPGVAPVAVQQGRHAARSIVRTLRGEPRSPFRYKDLGTLATIGRGAAVGAFDRVRLTGWVAWLVWLFVHIMKLVGYRNRLVVLVQWAWAYLTYQRSARLITGGAGVDASRERAP